MKDDLATFLKGFAMGAANVVPGVSGGTIAFITGIYERLINALKAFDLEALKLVSQFRIGEVWVKIDGRFLLSLGMGVVASVLTLAKVLKWGFDEHPVLIWSSFFGLIAASIPSVGKMVQKWTGGVMVLFFVGLAIAVSMAFVTPASTNENSIYLLLCGVAAMCSMIIPGLSGSFVLLLMGNYELVAIDTINHLRQGNFGEALPILIPVGVGAGVGLLVLSRFLSWLFKAHHDKAVGAITGFVAGSLVIIWPWKDTIKEEFVKNGEIDEKIVRFENWRLPDFSTGSTWMQIAAVLAGIALIAVVEILARKNQKS